jgi:hypothetical protein
MKNSRILTLLLLFCVSLFSNSFDKRGLLIWFYALEVKEPYKSAKIYKFHQSAGANLGSFEIHNISALSSWSKISKDKLENYFLDISKKVSIKSNKLHYLDFYKFYATTPTLVKKRIDLVLSENNFI